MRTKTKLPAAASSATFNLVAVELNIDPELAEFYMYSFWKEWGKESYLSLVRFMKWCIENSKTEIIAPTLAHDLFLKNVKCSSPRSSGY